MLSGEELATAIAASLNFLKKSQEHRLRQMVVSGRLYGNLSILGRTGINYSGLLSVQAAMRDMVTDNIVESVIDTLTAKIAENKPKPYYLTSGGSFRQQRKAKNLNKLVDGIYYEAKTYSLGPLAFRDAAIWGDGLIFVGRENNRVIHRRVLASELWLDEEEGKYGFPRSIHWARDVDRDELIGAFPSKRAAIIEANAKTTEKASTTRQSIGDLVEVRESWHLPSSPEAKDGKHVISIEGVTLLAEPYKRNHFPFARMTWAPRPLGYWSQGAAERLQPLQLQINRLLGVMQRSIHLASTFKIFIQNGSKIVREHITNDIGALIYYTGQPPIFYVPQAVPPEYYEHYMRCKEAAFEQEGVSRMEASGRKPAGLNSGRAIRESRDISTERFSTLSRSYDDFYLELATLSIEECYEIAKEAGGKYKVTAPDRKHTSSVELTAFELDLEGEEFVLQCFPISKLPSDPAGRLETIQEYIQAGFITPRQGRRALDFPDLDSVESLANAQEDIITKVLDDIADGVDFVGPEPTDDLGMCKEMVLEYIQRGRAQDLEAEYLEDLRRWNLQVDWLQQQAQAQAMAQAQAQQAAAAPQGQPQAVPQPPPVSELLPNAPGLAA